MRLPVTRLATVVLAAVVLAAPACAGPAQLLDALTGTRNAVSVSAAGSIEIAFSPAGGGQDLVLRTIDLSRREVRVLAYSFTSAPITAALLRAKKRGVDVAIVVDHKSNLENGNGAKSRAALGALAAAGVAVRSTSRWAIHHDKVIVVDGRHVQTGSFNYSDAAERRNSENVILLKDNAELATAYLAHWRRNWESGVDYVPGFAR